MQSGLKKILLGVIFFLSFQTAPAEDIPDRVYLWNTLEPTYYFNNGILSLGTDSNLLDLISGNSIFNDSAGYIPTMTNRSYIMHVLQWMLENREESQPAEYWLYSIRPSLAFYNVNDSLHASSIIVQDQNPDLFDHLTDTMMMLRSTHTEMYVAREEIVSSQIESATLYGLVNGRLTAIEARWNPNYISANPVISPDDILVTGSIDQYLFYSDLGAFHILPGAFCQAFSSGDMAIKSTLNATICREHTYTQLQLKLRRNIVLIS